MQLDTQVTSHNQTARKGGWPISDHCNGKVFFNPTAQTEQRGLKQVLRWRLQAKPAVWPKRLINEAFPPPPTESAPGTAAISFINHSSFLIRLPGAVVLTDPIFSERCSPVTWAGPKRVRAPGIPLAHLPRPDVVVLSHNHYDHMDLPTLRWLHRRHTPAFVTLLGNAKTLAKIGISAIELDWWQAVSVGHVHLTATPARHFAARTPFDRNEALWGGFMISPRVEREGGRVLFAGDSGAGQHWDEIRTRLGPPDVALLPIGAYEPRWFMGPVHMNPADAVQAHLALGAHRSIGMHFGTFQLTDEPIDAPLHALAAAMPQPGVFTTHGFGETRVYQLGRA